MPGKQIIVMALALWLGIMLSPHVLAEEAEEKAGTAEIGGMLADGELAAMRGGEDQYLNDMELSAQLYENQAISNVTGSNIITQDAFAGAKGFATIIQNSGNNVIIQNATILNLRLQ
ncbi:MAG: hypothetical protein HY272_09280 [Gammaproteobacteria bacterium]|nr:hypothetical protein [Gammaproteobacteria bacterium]